ncbi:predicted protein [Plenodomus lingam JN3]|uniref:Predicted protein n=1 Tax=Leptosphaeria maculans (strain JN3 / isolate v23.1.3 / race Av1-4-5-6-7-8) TaxID=985895 RepID=E4ZX09_LEPMJ|nr:predicted protein [Plenodomus lingam JN3]CBX95219.1 predicted protein [Plenodomus lingam JN3]
MCRGKNKVQSSGAGGNENESEDDDSERGREGESERGSDTDGTGVDGREKSTLRAFSSCRLFLHLQTRNQGPCAHPRGEGENKRTRRPQDTSYDQSACWATPRPFSSSNLVPSHVFSSPPLSSLDTPPAEPRYCKWMEPAVDETVHQPSPSPGCDDYAHGEGANPATTITTIDNTTATTSNTAAAAAAAAAAVGAETADAAGPSGRPERNSVVPPYWRKHDRNPSRVSSYSTSDNGHPTPIGLEDHTDEGSDQCKVLWAKSVTIDDYVVVSGTAPGLGAYVVWNCTVETLDGGPMKIRKRWVEQGF